MSDVLNRVVASYVTVARRRRLDVAHLFSGLSFDEAALAHARGRVPWDDYTIFVDRLEQLLGGPQGLDHLFEEVITTARPLQILAAMVLGTWELYELACVVNHSVNRVVRSRLDPLSDGRFRLEFVIPPERRGCLAGVRGTVAMLRTYPRLLGLGDAMVTAEVSSHRGIYWVRPPKHDPIVARSLRALRAPLGELLGRRGFAGLDSVDDLGDTLEVGSCDQGIRAVADAAGQRLLQASDFETLRTTLSRTLDEQALSRGFVLSVRRQPNEPLERLVRVGSMPPTTGGRYVGTLRVAEQETGQLEVEVPTPTPRPTRLMLDALLPWLAVATDRCMRANGACRERAALAHLPRYLEPVASLLGQGLSDKEVALELGLTVRTVRTYVARLYERLHVRNRTQLAVELLARRGRWSADESTLPPSTPRRTPGG